MTLLHTVIFSIVEGLTEFLPISSTGHLILTAKLLGVTQTTAQESFEIAIQLGAILAVVVVYAKSLLKDLKTMVLVGCAFVPTAVIGFLLHGFLKRVLLGSTSVVLWSLLIGGVILIVFERFVPRRAMGAAEAAPAGESANVQITAISPAQAFLVGVFQSFALIPGVSRSAATIVGGELIGIPRKTIVDFSFLLAIPTMAAATGYDLLKTAGQFTTGDVQSMAIGIVITFIVALCAIRWFLGYIKNHSFMVFGWYRVLLVMIFFVFFMR